MKEESEAKDHIEPVANQAADSNAEPKIVGEGEIEVGQEMPVQSTNSSEEALDVSAISQTESPEDTPATPDPVAENPGQPDSAEKQETEAELIDQEANPSGEAETGDGTTAEIIQEDSEPDLNKTDDGDSLQVDNQGGLENNPDTTSESNPPLPEDNAEEAVENGASVKEAGEVIEASADSEEPPAETTVNSEDTTDTVEGAEVGSEAGKPDEPGSSDQISQADTGAEDATTNVKIEEAPVVDSADTKTGEETPTEETLDVSAISQAESPEDTPDTPDPVTENPGQPDASEKQEMEAELIDQEANSSGATETGDGTTAEIIQEDSEPDLNKTDDGDSLQVDNQGGLENNPDTTPESNQRLPEDNAGEAVENGASVKETGEVIEASADSEEPPAETTLSSEDTPDMVEGAEVGSEVGKPDGPGSSDQISEADTGAEDATTNVKIEEAPVVDSADTKTPTQEETPSEKETTAEEEIPSGEPQVESAPTSRDFEQIEYSELSKTELVELVEKLARVEDPEMGYKLAMDIRSVFDSRIKDQKAELLKAFVDDGGEEDDFKFEPDNEIGRFHISVNLLRDRRNQLRRSRERSREENLEVKQELLEKLRHLVDGEETNASMKSLKELQAEWKNTGQVPAAQAKTMWANYNALITRFYDNRSIYFELKELDRKKNLEAKEHLCEKAEALKDVKNIREAIKDLNEFHEEFKHIGPVPLNRQEDIWTRFKTASDSVYARRKEFYEGLKQEYSHNLEAKRNLIQKLEEFLSFQSDRIGEWNAKTKEILDLQKRWEAIGGLPREKAKEINKQFWTAFKKFFGNKSAFFKQLEGQRQKNLELKERLVQQAEEVKESHEWVKTAELLKQLQADWREIGPVPESSKDSIYKKFKAACDAFFENKRGQRKEVEKEFEINLQQKEALCSEMEEQLEKGKFGQEDMASYLEKWEGMGFVPRNAVKKIQGRFDGILSKLLEAAPDLDADQIQDLKMSLKLRKIKSGPNAQNKLFKRELNIKKQIGRLESDLSAWNTNLGYFADSKNAEILKKDFQDKIDKANKELSDLKKELKILYQM